MQHRWSFTAGAGVLLALAAAPSTTAHAHPPPFYRMPDLSAHGRLGLELVPTFAEPGGEPALMIDSGVFADVPLTRRLVLSGRVPFAYVHHDPPGVPPEISSFAFGSIAGGLRFVDRSSRGRGARTRYGLGFFLHAPTASDSGEPGRAAAVSRDLTVPDQDRYTGSTTLRFDLDGRYEARRVFLQSELSLLYLARDAEDRLDLRLGLGAGIILDPNWAVLAELTTRMHDIAGDEFFRPALDAGLRYHDAGLMTGLRVFWPLHERQRSANAIGLGVDLAARF